MSEWRAEAEALFKQAVVAKLRDEPEVSAAELWRFCHELQYELVRELARRELPDFPTR